MQASFPCRRPYRSVVQGGFAVSTSNPSVERHDRIFLSSLVSRGSARVRARGRNRRKQGAQYLPTRLAFRSVRSPRIAVCRSFCIFPVPYLETSRASSWRVGDYARPGFALGGDESPPSSGKGTDGTSSDCVFPPSRGSRWRCATPGRRSENTPNDRSRMEGIVWRYPSRHDGRECSAHLDSGIPVRGVSRCMFRGYSDPRESGPL